MKNCLFYIGIGLLFTHELDAMSNHEWRVLPLIRLLPESDGMALFVSAHVPLFAVLIAGIASSEASARKAWRIGIGCFLIIHGLLHVLFMKDLNYEFASALSNVLIFGAMVFGSVFLMLEAKWPSGH